MDHSVAPPFELGPHDWRKLTIVLGTVAALEALLLLVLAVVLIVPRVSHHLQQADSTIPKGAVGPHTPAGRAKLAPAQTPVMVLNGNGHSGAAATSAREVRQLGYKLGLIGNAQRMDYPASLVMYRPASGRRRSSSRSRCTSAPSVRWTGSSCDSSAARSSSTSSARRRSR